MTNKEAIIKDIDNINKQIDTVQKNLIEALEVVGIEYINLYQYIDTINNLKQLKQSKKQQLILCDV